MPLTTDESLCADVNTVSSAEVKEDGSLRPSVQAQRRFPTTRRLVRRTLDTSKDRSFLEKWQHEKGFKLGPGLSDKLHLELLRVVWTYRDLESTGISDMGPPTDLIQHRTRIRPGTPVYKAKQKRYAPSKEFWLRKFVSEGLDQGMYELTTVANGSLSPWCADAVVVDKPGSSEPRLTFNYHNVFEEIPGNQMQLSDRAHRFLAHPSHKRMSKADLKNGYWVTEIHPDDRYFLAFFCPGIGQCQPTRMAQGARSSSFTMNELGAIAFGKIPEPSPEPSLLEEKGDDPADMIYYVDDLFSAHDSDESEVAFLRDHLFPRLLWARLKLSLRKLELAMREMLALGEIHHVGGLINPRPERVKLIGEWPPPKTAASVRAFMGTVATLKKWVVNFTETARPMYRLMSSRIPWRWDEAEDVSFNLLKIQCAHAGSIHGWMPSLPVEMFLDASGRAIGCYIRQYQYGEWKPIFYDSVSLSKSERNYDTYKRELKAIVCFAKKHSYMLQGYQTSTIWTDHKPLTGFLNSRTHEDIFARWAQTLRGLNIKIAHIEGTRNEVADALSRTIFTDDCEPTEVTHFLKEKIDRQDPWLWKTGKGGYRQWLSELGESERRAAIQQAECNLIEGRCGWETFGLPSIDHCTITVEVFYTETDRANADIREKWYGDIERYLRFQTIPQDWSKDHQDRFKRTIENFRWNESSQCLMHLRGKHWIKCIGPEEIQPVLERAHDQSGHFAIKIVVEKLLDRVWWPCMASDIRKYINSCIACIRASDSRQVRPLVSIKSLRPFHILIADYIGPFPPTAKGNTHVLNIMCYFSRFTYAAAVAAPDGQNTVAVLRRMFNAYTSPVTIYLDQGSGLWSDEVSTFLRQRSVIAIPIPTQAHRAAGMIEVSNKVLQRRLFLSREDIGDIIKKVKAGQLLGLQEDRFWDDRLGHAVSAINHHHMVEIGYSPVEIAMGATTGELLDLEDKYPSCTRLEVLEIASEFDIHPTNDLFDEAIHIFMARRCTRARLVHAENCRVQALRKQAYEHGKQSRSFEVGDVVMRYDERRVPKLQSHWDGPYRIMAIRGENDLVYDIKPLKGFIRKKLAEITHAGRLKKVPERESYLAGHDWADTMEPLDQEQDDQDTDLQWQDPKTKEVLRRKRKELMPTTNRLLARSALPGRSSMTSEEARMVLQEETERLARKKASRNTSSIVPITLKEREMAVRKNRERLERKAVKDRSDVKKANVADDVTGTLTVEIEDDEWESDEGDEIASEDDDEKCESKRYENSPSGSEYSPSPDPGPTREKSSTILKAKWAREASQSKKAPSASANPNVAQEPDKSSVIPPGADGFKSRQEMPDEYWKQMTLRQREHATHRWSLGKVYRPRGLWTDLWTTPIGNFTAEEWGLMSKKQRMMATRAEAEGRDPLTRRKVAAPGFTKEQWDDMNQRQRQKAWVAAKNDAPYRPKVASWIQPQPEKTKDELKAERKTYSARGYTRMNKPPPPGFDVEEWTSMSAIERDRERQLVKKMSDKAILSQGGSLPIPKVRKPIAPGYSEEEFQMLSLPDRAKARKEGKMATDPEYRQEVQETKRVKHRIAGQNKREKRLADPALLSKHRADQRRWQKDYQLRKKPEPKSQVSLTDRVTRTRAKVGKNMADWRVKRHQESTTTQKAGRKAVSHGRVVKNRERRRELVKQAQKVLKAGEANDIRDSDGYDGEDDSSDFGDEGRPEVVEDEPKFDGEGFLTQKAFSKEVAWIMDNTLKNIYLHRDRIRRCFLSFYTTRLGNEEHDDMATLLEAMGLGYLDPMSHSRGTMFEELDAYLARSKGSQAETEQPITSQYPSLGSSEEEQQVDIEDGHNQDGSDDMTLEEDGIEGDDAEGRGKSSIPSRREPAFGRTARVEDVDPRLR